MTKLLLILAIAGLSLLGQARADTLYTQAHSGTGAGLQSSTWDPDGSDYDQWVWDGFLLPAAANITEVRWRGTGGTINDFEVSIYASIPAGTQPDLGYLYPGPLMHRFVGSNAGQTYAGTFGGVAMYDYHFTLPSAFAAAANTRYWLQIEAWQPGMPTWQWATGGGGNGSHFHCIAGAADRYYYSGSNDAAFTLIGTPNSCTAPTITQNPTPVSVCYGGPSATLTCAATGTGTLAYRWRLNGNPVYDGPNGGGHGGGATISGATTPTLTIVSPSYWADAGTYDCMVSNACGPSYTTGALVSVPFGGPTSIASPSPQSLCAGDTLTLATSAANGPLTYQWKKNGVALADGPTPSGSAISGAATASLSITSAQPSDQGTYTCAITNVCSTASTTGALVTINDAPTITTQPASGSLCSGNAAMLAIAATNAATYQWQIESPSGSGSFVDLLDGSFTEEATGLSLTAAGMATTTLQISSVVRGSHSNTLTFAAIAANPCGGSYSLPATLTVNSADFNNDGDVGTDADIEAFFACLAGNCCTTCGTADFNGDGDVGTDMDIEAFFRVLAGGPC